MMTSYGVLKFGSDPQLVKVGNTVKSSFSLFYTIERQDISGNKIKENHFLDFEIWDKAADYVTNNCKKGDSIYVEATPKQETWEKEGQKRSKTIFRINSFKLFN